MRVTAIYPTHAEAERVRGELEQIGIGRSFVKVVPDHDQGVVDGPKAEHLRDEAMAALRALDLPRDELETYQGHLLRGDFVVSVEVEDDDPSPVRQVMRTPAAARG